MAAALFAACLIAPAKASAAQPITAQKIEDSIEIYAYTWARLEPAIAERSSQARRQIGETCPDLAAGIPPKSDAAADVLGAVFASIYQHADPPLVTAGDAFLSSIRRLPGVRANPGLRGALRAWHEASRRALRSIQGYDASRLCADVTSWRAVGWSRESRATSPSRTMQRLQHEVERRFEPPLRRQLVRIGVDAGAAKALRGVFEILEPVILPPDSRLRKDLFPLVYGPGVW
jgi:hypothetical protein